MVAFGDEPLRESRTSLVAASGGGNRIQISVPAEPADADDLRLANLGWKALMVSGVAAADDDTIVEFAVDWPGITSEQRQLMQFRLRSRPGVPMPNNRPQIGTVSVDAARAQLASSIQVVRSVYPAETIRETRIVVVPIDPARQLFGLEADIRASRLDDLKPKLGAVVGGLMTGLVGDDNAVIEGLAINVVDDDGQRAGWFHATRAGVGMGIVPPGFGREMPPVDVKFPNLTGGPGTSWPATSGRRHAPPG